MKYNKIEKDNYNIHIIDTNRFKEMHIVMFLTRKCNNDEMALGNLLCSNITYTSKKYNTKSKIATRGEELFGAKVSASFGYNGNTENIVLALQMLNPKYTEEKYLDESLDFYKEIVFNPNVDKGGFNKEFFDITKDNYLNSIKSMKDNAADYASILYNKIMYEGTIAEKSVPTIEEIESVTRKSLYEYYKKLFTGGYKIDICIYGEDSELLVDKIDKLFKNIKGNKNKLDFNYRHNDRKEVIEKIENTNFKQSRLYIGYTLKGLNYHEINHVLRVYSTILGSMNDSMLFNYVREKYSLCYSINSSYNKYDPVLTIYAGINKVNYEEAKKRIFETIEFMKDKRKLKRLFNQAKETYNTYINSFYDDLYGQINHFYYKEFNLVDDVEELRKNLSNVTIDEVIKLNDKMQLSTIFLMRGDD